MRVSTGEHPLLRAAQKRLDVLGGLGDVRDGAVLADHDAAVLYELELTWSAHTVHEAAAQHEPNAMLHSKWLVRRAPFARKAPARRARRVSNKIRCVKLEDRF